MAEADAVQDPGRAATVRRWARDTWSSLAAMVDRQTGLPADHVDLTTGEPERAGYTSPTDVGGYLWSTVTACALGLISAAEGRDRLCAAVMALGALERHEPTGTFYNWYVPATGEVIRRWPVDGSPVRPFVSCVDNAWLAVGLLAARSAGPELAATVDPLLAGIDLTACYDPAAGAAGLLWGGFWTDDPAPDAVPGNVHGHGCRVHFAPFHYDTTVSESRIASYLGIALGGLPPAHYFSTWRTFPDSEAWSWQQQRPAGRCRRYLGVDVFEGTYAYRGMRLVPSWGGSMFEALMPDLFVPEAAWGPRSWGTNHRLTVQAQREFGMDDARYGYWGFSPASRPGGDYGEWGAGPLGLKPDGYPSALDEEGRDGVVTPHALFLAAQYEPATAFATLDRIEHELLGYGPGGFYDAVAVRSGLTARRHLALDQAMTMAAIGNITAKDLLRETIGRGAIRRRLAPLLALEEFGSAARR